MPGFIYCFLYIWQHWVVCYVWVYNVLEVMIYLGGQLSQFALLQSIHCSPFLQIFLLGLGNVFCIPPRLNIYA